MTGRPAGQAQHVVTIAMFFHQLNAFQWFDRANQNPARGTRRLGAYIQHKMRAIIKKYVRMPGFQIHRADPWSRPAKMMPGRIARRVRFRFHDAPTHSPRRQFVYHHFSNQKPRQLNRIAGQFRPPQPPDHALLRKFFWISHEGLYSKRFLVAAFFEPLTSNL